MRTVKDRGVRVVMRDIGPLVICMKCPLAWYARITSKGRLAAGWWKCPNGRNAPKKKGGVK